MARRGALVRWFEDVRRDDVASVGGKNASLGEMTAKLRDAGIAVPGGFATTAAAYRQVLREAGLDDAMREQLEALERDPEALPKVGAALRKLVGDAPLPKALEREIREAYAELSRRYEVEAADVAVRSSATAEDLPEASFAGQQETFLNVRGADAVLAAVRRCMASLFTDRAIAYRDRHGFDHLSVALSVGVQKMVRSDKAGAGVAFTLDPETGFPRVVVINAAFGLGESVVSGQVDPDQYVVFRPLLGQARPIVDKRRGGKEIRVDYGEGGEGRETVTREVPEGERLRWVLSDDEILTLATWCERIEAHYGRPMDIEWAKDGESGELFIVQARPETVQRGRNPTSLESFRLEGEGERLVTGLAIGQGIAAGPVCVLGSAAEGAAFPEGGVLVTAMTDPDWVPVMRRAAAIVTDHGGRTSHAAIVSRELGVPAVIGAGDATATLRSGDEVTVSCAEGDAGYVYRGRLAWRQEAISLEDLPETRTRLMMNLATPDAAFRWWRLPARGVGLARMEFILSDAIRVHPMALLRPEQVEDAAARREIEALTAGYEDKAEYFVERLAFGIARIAAALHPEPVVVRTSDFKTNEYAQLLGGRAFEPREENPMLGFRGASRYYSPRYRDAFALECRALRRVREEMGLANVVVMIPFCRTLEEADRVLEIMAEQGLRRGERGLEVFVMAEIPSNILLTEGFAERFDGFSIGSNDLTQLTLGVDRDSAELKHVFDERNPAVKALVADLIRRAHAAGRKVGICGQAPSDYPDFAAFLVEEGIDSISLNPDSLVRTLHTVAEAEARLKPS